MCILYAWIGPMADNIKRLFRHFLSHSWEFDPNPENVYSLSIDVTLEIARMIMPILLTLGFLAFLAQRLQVGKLWTTKVMRPNMKRFNIVQGLKQMLASPQTALRTIKSLLFSLVLGLIPGWIIFKEHQNFLPMYYASTEGVATYMLQMAFKLTSYALLPIIAIAVFDVWQSHYAYNEGMKMTKSEVKDEQKQAEVDPFKQADIRIRVRPGRSPHIREPGKEQHPEHEEIGDETAGMVQQLEQGILQPLAHHVKQGAHRLTPSRRPPRVPR